MSCFYIIFERRYGERALGAFLQPVVLGLMATAAAFFPSGIQPLMPARHHSRRLLGQLRLGTLLGMGSQRNVRPSHLAHLWRLPAHARSSGLDRHAAGGAAGGGLRSRALHVLRRSTCGRPASIATLASNAGWTSNEESAPEAHSRVRVSSPAPDTISDLHGRHLGGVFAEAAAHPSRSRIRSCPTSIPARFGLRSTSHTS